MRSRWLSLLIIVILGHNVVADDADTFAAQGEEKARSGEFTRAIELFKKADQLKPSAKHACLIALVYIRRELWPQAELFLDRCKQRSTLNDPLPDWFQQATEQLRQKLEAVDVATVDIHVDPPELASSVQVGVSSFAPDEKFPPRTLHLAPGVYIFTATGPDGGVVSETATIKLGTKNEVTLKFQGTTKQPDHGGGNDATKPVGPTRPTTVTTGASGVELRPWSREKWFFVGGGAVLAVGVVFNVIARGERTTLAQANSDNDPMAWENAAPEFERNRAISYAGIGVGIGIAAGAVILHYVRPAERSGPTVVGGVTANSAFVGVEVRR